MAVMVCIIFWFCYHGIEKILGRPHSVIRVRRGRRGQVQLVPALCVLTLVPRQRLLALTERRDKKD